MTLVEQSVMLNMIMGKMYNILTNGDDSVPMSEDNFLSWATPGIPIEAGDLVFLAQGLTGIAKTDNPEVQLTPQQIESLRAADTAKLYIQAENFARLVDFVPDVAGTTNGQLARLSIMSNEGTLSERYEYILRMSQVMKQELPEKTRKKIEEFRKLLTVTKVKRNLLDDSETEVTEPSPMVIAYNDKLAAYENACLEYNSHRVDALAADNVKAIHYFALNAKILRNRVTAAMNDWVANGYKNEYEQIAAFIEQVMGRDMALLKAQYRDDLERARLTGLASGSDFFYTSLVPGNFLTGSGWTEFGFSSYDYNSSSNSGYSLSRSSTSGGGTFLGIFGAAGNYQTAESESGSQVRFDSDDFSMSFEITQVPIVRPWFKTSFLVSKLWRFDQNDPEAKDEVVSDGAEPAKGLIAAYPVSMICVRDLSMRISNSSGFQEMHRRWESTDVSAGAVLAFGPFHLAGSHGRSSESGARSSSYSYDGETGTIRVEGAQVIGFRCHLMPKSPDPDSSIQDWV